MPKPINFLAGNGMHINLSILRNNKNIFYDTTQKYNLSAFAADFANNVSKHIGAICAFSNPIINSYKRLNANMETPTSVRLGYKDRQSSCRIPQFSEATARVEFRFPDTACQVYLTLCAIIASGFENIFNKTTQTIIVPKSLPKSLNESLRFLKQDKFIGKFPADKATYCPFQHISSTIHASIGQFPSQRPDNCPFHVLLWLLWQ